MFILKDKELQHQINRLYTIANKIHKHKKLLTNQEEILKFKLDFQMNPN
jgi:hypothetical protein